MNTQLYNSQLEQQKQDMNRVWEAFEELKRFEKKYGDLVVFPEVITMLDIADTVLGTRGGPVPAKDIYTRDELLAALQVIKASPGADIPATIFYAVSDYRETQKTQSKKEKE